MEENKKNKKNYPGVFQAIMLVLFTLFILIFLTFVMAVILRVNDINETDLTNSVTYILLVIVVPVLTFSLVTLYVSKIKGLSLDYIIGSNVKSFSIYGKIVLLMMGLTIVLSDLNNLIQKLIPMNEEFSKMIGGIVDNNFLLVFIGICVVAPIFEELFFRGILLRGLLHNMEHWSAIFFSSFLFAVFHLNIWQGISAFFSGLFIGWLLYKTGSLKTSIFAHFINNFVVFLAVYLIRIPGFSVSSETGFQPIWFTLLGVAMLILAVYLIENSDTESIDV